MQSRPKLLVGVIGTRTEIGKTYVACQWLRHLRETGAQVAARKPVQSFELHDETDAAQLARSTGELEDNVCPPHRHYPIAVAPPMAADLLKKPRISITELVSEIVWPAHTDVGLVETVGGPYSPLAHDGDSIDLLCRLQPDRLLLVADAGLGTLNAVRLVLLCIAQSPLHSIKVTVFLNRYDENVELHRLNKQWLQRKYSVTAVTSIDAIN